MTTTGRIRRLTLEHPPAIPGLEARFFADASDYARLSELTVAANEFDEIPYLPSAADLKVEMEAAEGLDPVDDVVFVEVDGRLIAATGLQRVVRDDVPTYDIWGTVDPGHRRLGLGTALMAWTLERARVRASREDTGMPVALGSFAEDTETGHRALLASVGFEPVRHFFLMRRVGLDDIPDAPLPDGVEIRPVDEDQWRTILDAENEAFRDHWGHREMGESAYRATFGRTGLDTSLWVVAWDGDEVAGVVQNWIWALENERLGVERGWLEHISVRRPWRRRGLGRAITAAALVRLREAGLEEAMLGVDSENPNGALGLYEGLGFAVESRAAAYRRPLRP
ncbi:MAG TPA: GNAT family N-acetyltransferase [Candidatus Limnocylindrales bacterium]